MRFFASAMTFVAVAASATAAQASNWWFVDWVGEKPHRRVYFIDKSSIRQVKPSVFQAWESQYNETRSKENPWDTEKELHQYNCSDRSVSLITWIEYTADGGVLRTQIVPEYQRDSIPAVPDTIGEAMLKVACGEASGNTEIERFDPVITGRAVLSLADYPPTPEPTTQK